MSTFWIIMGIVAICGVIYYFVQKNKVQQKPSVSGVEKPDPEVVEEASVDLTEQFQGLIKASLMIYNDSHRDKEILEVTDIIIDRFVELLPEVNERFPANKTVLVLNQAARVYLVDQFEAFLALRPDKREEKRAALLEALHLISKDLSMVQGIVTRGQISDLNKEIGFITKRFTE